MQRLLYIALEWAVVYLFCLGIGLAFLYFAGVFESSTPLLPELMVLVWAVACIPLAAQLVLFGGGRLSLAGGFYDPVRPVATAARAGLFDRGDPDRTPIRFAYRDAEGRDPFEILRLLSADLNAQGIDHVYVGHISVTDGAARWRVEPALDDNLIQGWVEADDPDDRIQIVSGLRDFLTERLSLTLVEDGR